MEREHIDLIITDLMMPVMDGYEFIRSVRQSNPLIPVLIITAKDDFYIQEQGIRPGER